jgi:hypothetical protein
MASVSDANVQPNTNAVVTNAVTSMAMAYIATWKQERLKVGLVLCVCGFCTCLVECCSIGGYRVGVHLASLQIPSVSLCLQELGMYILIDLID